MFKEFFLNLSLNKKLTVMMLFLSFVMTSVLMVLYSQSEKMMQKQFESQLIELAKAIQFGVEEITSQGSTDEMRLFQYLKKLNAKGIKEITIISNEDEIIASTNVTKIGNPVGPKKKELIIKAELGESLSTEEDRVYNVILPVIVGDEHYGYIHLSINTEDFSKVMRASMIKRVIGTIIVFALGIGLAMLLSWRYTKPIHELANAVKKVSAGNLNHQLITEQKDEIGELAKDFNYMVQKLREQKSIEERLREAEHLSGIGQLSRSIAHEIRNPLNFISLSVDHIKEKYKPTDNNDKEKFNSLISSIKQEIQRLNTLVENFLDYGKPLRLNRKEVDIGQLMNNVIELIHAKADNERIRITRDINTNQVLDADPELLKTCILNVILNAFQAMPNGGELSIKTELSDGKFQILISDTGTGIKKDEISKVFDPFFTTKKNGLGLGLSMTKRVIEEHGGEVDINSTEGKGSKVIISLPTGSNPINNSKGE